MNDLQQRLEQALLGLRVLLIDDWREALKWSSVRLHVAVIALNAICAAMPELDPSIAGMLPKALQNPIIGIYAAVALALRLTKLKPNG